MPDPEREVTATAIWVALEGQGYVYLDGQIARDTGEVRMNFVRPGGQLWVNLRDKPPSVLEEFCNVYEEVHALGIGLIHSCTRLRPMKYSEIDQEDLSPELKEDLRAEHHYYLAAFWGLRAAVALVYLVVSGSLAGFLHLFGW